MIQKIIGFVVLLAIIAIAIVNIIDLINILKHKNQQKKGENK